MLRRPGRLSLLVGAALVGLFVAGRAAAGLYTDALWFSSLGYSSVFWRQVGTGLVVRLIAGGVAAGVVFLNLWIVGRQIGPVRLRRRYGNLEISEQIPAAYITAGMAIAAVLSGWWLSGIGLGADFPIEVLAWLGQVPWGLQDPLFDLDLSFYVFSLPVYNGLADYFLLLLLWSIVIVVLGYVVVGAVRWRQGRLEVSDAAHLHFVVLLAVVVLLVGVRYWLGCYGLLLDGNGVGGALGYTDVQARLPARRAMALLCLVATGTLLYGAWRRAWGPAFLTLGALVLGAVGTGYLYPGLVQKLRVEPNQFAREAPYIRWNLEFTRRAYGLDRLERRAFPFRRTGIPPWRELAPLLAKLPLWDLAPLDTVYNQLQALQGYYHFPDVDYDRYGPPSDPVQVAIAVREFKPEGLPETARRWQSLHLNPTYIRGMGAVVTPVAQITAQGEPDLWVENLNPVRRDPVSPAELELTEPRIYFGETMRGYVVLIPARDTAFAGTPGQDLPAGIRLSSFLRRLSFAWRFGDKNLLLSGDISGDSYLIFRRSLAERLAALAPFILWDPDPYPVIHRGRIVWIVDGYTTSASFPLARAIDVEDVRLRYLRNSVKAAVDAVTGAVTLYAVDGSDPVLETYRRVFRDLVRPIEELAPELHRHLRYPALYLTAQAEVLKEYHLERPEAFYAGQDVWQFPEVRGRQGASRSYSPMYALMPLPGEKKVEFLLLMPFIARERQNMTALLVARNDPPHYGELILLELPRDQLVPGPNQVQTLIEQDPVISPQLSLWRQSGSNVELGNLRVIPLESELLYVEPLFLSAHAKGSPIPELRRVAVSDGRTVAMASALGEAIEALRAPVAVGGPVVGSEVGVRAVPTPGEWPEAALRLLEEADQRLRSGDFAGFGERWSELRELLRGMVDARR